MKETHLQSYHFSGKVWKYSGPAGWYFVSLPKKISKSIRENHQECEEGWGRLKSAVSLEGFSWNTSIWFDTKLDCYLLPLKAPVRKKIGITEGNLVKIDIQLEDF